MTSEVNVVSAKFVRMLGRQLAGRASVLGQILKDHGVDPEILSDNEAEIPIGTFARVLEEVADTLGEPCLGLEWAQTFPLGATGIFGYLIMHSRTIDDALQHSARFANLVMSPVKANYFLGTQDGHEVGEFNWIWPPWLPEMVQYRSFMSALMVLRLRTGVSRPWSPVAVRLQCREPPCPALVRRVYGDVTTFNAPRNAIVVDSRDLGLEYIDADRRLLAIIKDQAEHLLAEVPNRSELVQQVQSAILDKLGKGEISLDAVAGELQMPVRTLQARLAQQGETSFETLLNDTRRSMARHYLGESDHSLTEIAFLLGYSELSAFTRAAQRWFGASPSTFRQQQRELKQRS